MTDRPDTATRYTDAYGPNVQDILCRGSRVISAPIPAPVRRELSAAVRDKVLGRLKKDGLKPEVFFHPDHLHGARERQAREAAYAARCIASVMATGEQRAEQAVASLAKAVS